MTRSELGFASLERAVISWIETRTAEVVVAICSNNRGHPVIGAMGRPSTLVGIAGLRAHGSKGAFGKLPDGRCDKFSIRNLKTPLLPPLPAFTGSAGKPSARAPALPQRCSA
jgi:hypothetical protein